jgi:hypothetical protein
MVQYNHQRTCSALVNVDQHLIISNSISLPATVGNPADALAFPCLIDQCLLDLEPHLSTLHTPQSVLMYIIKATTTNPTGS